jgi:hypothetical protein
VLSLGLEVEEHHDFAQVSITITVSSLATEHVSKETRVLLPIAIVPQTGEGFDGLKIKVNGYLQPPFPVDHLYKVSLHYSIYVTLTNTLLYIL